MFEGDTWYNLAKVAESKQKRVEYFNSAFYFFSLDGNENETIRCKCKTVIELMARRDHEVALPFVTSPTAVDLPPRLIQSIDVLLFTDACSFRVASDMQHDINWSLALLQPLDVHGMFHRTQIFFYSALSDICILIFTIIFIFIITISLF